MAQKLKTDRILFYTTLIMVFFGLLILYSASSVVGEVKKGSPWHFVLRQLMWAGPSLFLMMYLKRNHYKKLENPTVAFIAIGIVLMLLIGVYFIDAKHHRWIRFGGFGFQPSELSKPALVLFLAYFVSMRAPAINNRYTLMPAALAVIAVIVIVGVADLGTAFVLGVTAAVVFIVAGLEKRYMGVVAILACLGVVGFIAQKPYRVARLIGFVDPGYRMIDRIDVTGTVHAYLNKSLTTHDTSYQSEQSKIAVGAGGALGAGLTQGKQKLLYLPEAHTDFIYAVVSEEMGLIGSAGVLLAFLIIFWRGLRTTVLVHDDFGRFIALGVTCMVVVQAFINMTSVLGLMPTKGIPLPMVSGGGSSLLSTLALLGMLMNVSEHAG